MPRDSTGIAHILEHTSLCGSRRFPVRDPFFMMIRRSLNTFMNAFTASDWTAYPFATRNRKDFDNLLEVYLDAAFGTRKPFPRLDRMDFAQEGHRVERARPDDPDSELVYKGHLRGVQRDEGGNEPPRSPGRATAPGAALSDHHLSPQQRRRTVRDPVAHLGDAPRLPRPPVPPLERSADDLRRPPLPAARHQEAFERLALGQFERREIDVSIPDERRYAEPRQTFDHYAANESETAARTHHLMGWLLGRAGDPDEAMRARLLAGVLLEHGGSPLRRALETTELGTAPSELSGLDDGTREATFSCGIEGSETEHADAFESLVLSVLDDIARGGVPREELESVIHQIELGQREITGGGFPYGLRLMVRGLGPILHGADGLAALDIDPALESLRREAADPGFIPRLVRDKLLDNPHRVRLTMTPDPELPGRRAAEERERLEGVRGRMSEADLASVDEAAAALKARQEADDDPSLLPKVGVEDIPEDLAIPEGQEASFGPAPGVWFSAGTNGLSYLQVIVDLPPLPRDLLDLLPAFCDCVSEVGSAGRDYLATQARQAAVTGGLGASLSVGTSQEDVDRLQGLFVLSGKALTRNQGALAELLAETFVSPRFDEPERLRELVAQGRAQAEAHVTRSGHVLAISAATAGLGRYAALEEEWHGMRGIRSLKSLDDSLAKRPALSDFAARLEAIRGAIGKSRIEILAVGEALKPAAECAGELARSIANGAATSPPFDPDFEAAARAGESSREAWLTTSEVSFCARAFPAVPQAHADAPALRVLGPYLRNTFLHRAIREQGGAYGAGAGYGADSGTFRFFSYRDPRIGGTFADFEAAVRRVLDEPQDEAHLEEAILGVISDLDRPSSPAGQAIGTYFGTRHGRDPAQRRRYRRAVLGVTLEDLRRVAGEYLGPERARDAVVTSEDLFAREPDRDGFETHRL